MNLEKRPQGIQDAADAEKKYQKELLEIVLEVAGDDAKMIDDGIIKALRGVNEEARRTYLWNTLSKAAAAEIRRVRQKYPIAS